MRRLLPSKTVATPATPKSPVSRQRSNLLLPIATVTWIALVAFGLGFLMQYANRPGQQGEAEPNWPANSLVSLSESRPTLILFAHPKCPCTRATMRELEWLMTHCRDDVECHVLFFHADGEDVHWGKTDCWRSANAIPGVQVRSDPESQVAKRFGVETSGHALLYDREGQLAFEGGITPSRGHSGDNPGRSKLLSLIKSGGSTPQHRSEEPSSSTAELRKSAPSQDADSTCVFGCPLHDPVVAARTAPDDNEG